MEIILKNISRDELTMDVEELTERFMRGDKSRNTEGSGLGLAIVKSFVELQGGSFHIEADGDLFKAKMSFPKEE
ncbi:MAG: ATP-binding protein [Blautia sp.]